MAVCEDGAFMHGGGHSKAKMGLQSFFMLMMGPPVLLGFVVERRRECADLGIGEASRGPIGIFADGVVMKDEHLEPRTVAGRRILEHLAVAGRVAESGVGAPPDLSMDKAFALPPTMDELF
jgi:hypothetical protein